MSQEIININELQTLYLGRRGENDVTEILFDISELQLEYGPGTVELLVKQPGSNELYPVVVSLENNFAKWLVRLEDVSVEGTGEVQLSYFVEKQCKKTTVYRTYISKSLGATTPTPDPGKDWVNHIIHIGASVEGEYKKAESYAHGGTGIREGEDTDNAKYYSDETKKICEGIVVEFEYIEQSKQEVNKNRVAVEQIAQEVEKSKQTVKQSEQSVVEKEKNVVVLEGSTQEVKKHVDTVAAEVDKNAKEVVTNKDIVVKVEQNVRNAISDHNVSPTAHEDIRGLISGLSARIDAVLDSDDVTLDQLSEIVAYIKSNKSLVEQVTTNKVNVSDIINNLTTNDSNKPLSASMGVELKRLVDELNKKLPDYVKKSEQHKKDNEQDEAIKKNTEDVVKLQIKETAKGKVINIPDSAEFPFVDYKVFGETEQVTTTGKNLFDIKNITPNNNELKIIQNGAIMSNSKSGYSLSYIDIPLLKSGGYRFSCNFEQKGDTTIIQIDGRKFETSTLTYNTQRQSSKTGKFDFSITIPAGETGMRIYLYSNASGIAKNVVLELTNIQLELGSVATPYEPYTGGKPSPSPEYLQEIVNGELRKIRVTGKNLSFLNQASIESKNSSEIVTFPSVIQKGQKIRCSYKSSSDLQNVTIRFLDKNNNAIETFYLNKKEQVTAKNDIYKFSIYNATDLHIILEDIQIESGTEITPYEPYKEQLITLSQPQTLSKWDRIERRDSVWGVVRIGASKIINVNDIIRLASTTTGKRILINVPEIAPHAQTQEPSDVYCNVLKSISINSQYLGEEGISVSKDSEVYLNILPYTSLEEYRKFIEENHIQIEYQKADETFEPLPLADQRALEKLHTFYPNTVVMTDKPVEQELTYVADSKNYIDRKLKEIVTASVKSTASLLALMPLETQAIMIENDTNNILHEMEVQKHE